MTIVTLFAAGCALAVVGLIGRQVANAANSKGLLNLSNGILGFGVVLLVLWVLTNIT